VFLPSEDEWYKAAYYNPATSSYFQFPTSSNTPPTASPATATPNSANYHFALGYGFTNDKLTDVGAYSGTTSAYGAFDMGGNVFQWNEAVITNIFGQIFRGLRGGAFYDDASDLVSSFQANNSPFNTYVGWGFRVASIPEPSSIALLAIGAIGLAAAARRRRQAVA
jgi:formylglycine-generating enzyme required for sulfatase activity